MQAVMEAPRNGGKECEPQAHSISLRKSHAVDDGWQDMEEAFPCNTQRGPSKGLPGVESKGSLSKSFFQGHVGAVVSTASGGSVAQRCQLHPPSRSLKY